MFVSQIIDEAMEVLGTTDKSKVYRKLTQAVRTLMQSGHYFHAIAEVDVCTGWDKQTITLPRGIEVPLAVNVDGSPTYFRDRLFQYHVNKGGMYNSVGWAWDDRGMVATQMDIRQPSQLVAVAEHEADAGKMLRVIGLDGNNRELRAQTDAGEGVDGMFVRVHALSDFPVGAIQPDGIKIETRNASVSPLNTFVSSLAHGLSSGEGAILNLVSGTIPPELEDGTKYWVGVSSDTEVQLFSNELDAKNGNNPISVSDISGSPVLKLTDSRPSQLYTVLSLTNGAPVVPISKGNEVTFGPINGGTLPSQLSQDKTYFVDQQEPAVLQVYETLSDARNEINPILLTGSNSQFNVFLRSPITPETKLTFPSSHGYQNGDIVQAYTNGGTLPQPLVAATNYYVHVIDSTTEYAVTLHVNYADAISGANPINLITAGVGQNSLAKLIPATANPGTKNNINVSGLNLPAASGSGAIVEAQVTGAVTSATLVNGGGGYTSATATLSDVGGYKYSSAPSVYFKGGSPVVPATAVASIKTDAATGYGYVDSVVVNSGGDGYDPISPPEVVFSGGLATGGVSAKAEAVVSKGAALGAIAGSQINSGGQYIYGSFVLFKDGSGSGSGATAKVTAKSGTSVTQITVTKTGSGYSDLQFAGVLYDPVVIVLSGTGGIGSDITFLNVRTLTDSIGVNILNGAIVGWQGGLFQTIDAYVAAINAATPTTLYWAEPHYPSYAVVIHPCVKLKVSNPGATGNTISALYCKYLNNDNPTVSESPINILTSTVTVTSGQTASQLATAIAAKVGNGFAAIANNDEVIIRPSSFVQKFYGTSSGSISLAYSTNDYPLSVDFDANLKPPSSGFHILSAIQPVINSVPTTGVISAVNLLPYGSGAAMNVSVNTVSNTVNGLNIASIGTDYRYPPRISITPPNNQYPTIQCTSSGASTGTLPDLSVVQSNGVTVNLTGTAPAVSNPASPNAVISALLTKINAQTATTGYSAELSQTGNDTLVVTPPSGVTVLRFVANPTNSPPMTFIQVIPSQALASAGITTSFVSGYKVINSGTGYISAPAVNLKGGGGSGASAVAVIDQNGIGSIAVLNGGTGLPATLTAQIVDQAGGTGSGCTVALVISAGTITAVNVLTPGKGYGEAQIVFTDPAGSTGWTPPPSGSFTFTKTGVVTNVNVVAEGTGYTSAPTVTIEPSTGIFVQFSSTGTLPSPIVQGQTYRAENPSSGSGFTLKNNDFSDVNITSTGSGTIYLVLSRAFSIGFTGNWSGDFSGITINPVKLQTDYQLPVTSPSTDTSTTYYLSKVTSTKALLYTTYTSGVLSGKITPTQLGVGQAYFAIPEPCTVSVYNNQILPSSITYLTDGMVVRFSSTSGTLPSPLATGTDYKINVSGNFVTVSTISGTPIVFTSLGNSQLSIDIIRTFTPEASSEVIVENCIFESLEKITVRSSSDDSLPVPLTSGTTYYIARSGDNRIKICSTLDNAKAGIPILLTSTGDNVDSIFIIDSIKEPTLVKSIMHVEKPLTLGYVSLYAFDYGRSNDMALIGQYHPSETNPKYRRIRIGRPCAWVRMAYRVKPVEVSSDADYIAVENERALLTALHAIDLEDKDFLEQAQKYWATALSYLKAETESMDGHAMVTPQINNITYGDGTDPIMF